MQVLSFPEAVMPLEFRLGQVRLQDQAWPSEQPSGPEPWHDPVLRPMSMLLVDDGRVVAALDILSKEIAVGGERYAASGVSALVTDPSERGKGYGRTLADAARRAMAEDGADLGIFTCDKALRAFYERAGWDFLAGSVVIGGTPEHPFPSDQLDKVTMASFFSGRARASAGLFLGCRIELYPGDIDTLW